MISNSKKASNMHDFLYPWVYINNDWVTETLIMDT